QILDAAALTPQIQFRLLWRPWGDSADEVRRQISERGLRNVEIAVTAAHNMTAEYQNAHVTVAPFTDLTRSKPAPNSLIESLACGRPVITTEVVGLAELVADSGSGLVVAPTGPALADGLGALEAGWSSFSRKARATAEKWFGIDRFLTAYQRLYDELLRG